MILITLICATAMVASARFLVHQEGATTGMSRYVYLVVDLPANTILLALTGTVAFFSLLMPTRFALRLSALSLPGSSAPLIAIFTLALAAVGASEVYQGHAFSMDEWMTRLQGSLFLNGQIAGEIPWDMRPYARAIFHPFTALNESAGTFASDYRPGMSAIYALFEVAGIGIYSSAAMMAGSVWMTALVARRIWPDIGEAPVIAALLVATSQQALAASLTTYAMSAHLCFNMLWLWLFLGNRWYLHLLAALVGVATASLHQIHVHAFFAAPFFLLLLRPLRLDLIALYGGIYLVGHFAVYSWDQISLGSTAQTLAGGERSLLQRFLRLLDLPDRDALATSAANLIRLFTWQSLAIPPLLLMLFWRRSWAPLMAAMAGSILFSLLPYPFLMADQGHGWGYRYMHGLIGPLAILAVSGWITLRDEGHAIRANFQAFVMASLVASALIMIPLRAYQINGLVGPYAKGTTMVQSIDADVVIIDSYEIYYGWDFGQNDPLFAEPPIIMQLDDLDLEKIRQICAAHRTVLIGADDVEPLGVPVIGSGLANEPYATAQMREAINGPDCRR
ncbi:MAG: hypothetical protein AAF367_18115 [Pseudomonadota bacterium]